MSILEQSFIITNPTGLHLRPAALLVNKAMEFSCHITLVKGEEKASADSLMSILALGIAVHDVVTVIASGDREGEALQAIGELLTKEE